MNPFPAFLAALFLCAQTAHADPMLRLICATGLSEEHKVVLAAKSEDGGWKELAAVELRSSMVSDWLPAQAGELHLAVKEEDALKSIGRFAYPAGARRALVTLTADNEEGTYTIHAIDPEKESFAKGNTLILNISEHVGTVSLGSDGLTVEAGQHIVAKPAPDGNGGYRLTVSYPDPGGEDIRCYDRQTVINANTRDILFLLPDETVGLRVLSIPLFGDLD
jgi:hypothetical protein